MQVECLTLVNKINDSCHYHINRVHRSKYFLQICDDRSGDTALKFSGSSRAPLNKPGCRCFIILIKF